MNKLHAPASTPAPAPAQKPDGLQLFDALFAAHYVLVNDYQIETVTHPHGDENLVMTECDQDNVWLFTDQPIQLDSLGQAQAVDKLGNAVTVEFRMSRPMTVEDPENI
ncbi:MAG: hypothetical protein O9327_01970 [Polaromonas sp.]|nr:hypothetical protein [Polaromonas sp.]